MVVSFGMVFGCDGGKLGKYRTELEPNLDGDNILRQRRAADSENENERE